MSQNTTFLCGENIAVNDRLDNLDFLLSSEMIFKFKLKNRITVNVRF